MSLLEVKNLNIKFHTVDKTVLAVKDFNLVMGREKIAIVGESGAGKSQSARAILGLCRGEVTTDKLEFDGLDIKNMPSKEFKKLRSNKMAMIMQDPKYSLNPIFKIESQMREVIPKLSKKEARDKIAMVLSSVNIRNPKKVMNSYPFELSGGIGQRVMIAQTILAQPDLLIADEPTSSIDATAKISVLNEMDKLVADNNMGMIFISHDLPLVASYCDRIIIMYQGSIVESILAKDLKNAEHPYTKALLSCIPNPKRRGKPLSTVSSFMELENEVIND